MDFSSHLYYLMLSVCFGFILLLYILFLRLNLVLICDISLFIMLSIQYYKISSQYCATSIPQILIFCVFIFIQFYVSLCFLWDFFFAFFFKFSLIYKCLMIFLLCFSFIDFQFDFIMVGVHNYIISIILLHLLSLFYDPGWSPLVIIAQELGNNNIYSDIVEWTLVSKCQLHLVSSWYYSVFFISYFVWQFYQYRLLGVEIPNQNYFLKFVNFI